MATRKAPRGGKAKREVIDVADDATARRSSDEDDDGEPEAPGDGDEMALALLARQSLADELNRDASDILAVTRA